MKKRWEWSNVDFVPRTRRTCSTETNELKTVKLELNERKKSKDEEGGGSSLQSREEKKEESNRFSAVCKPAMKVFIVPHLMSREAVGK